MFTKRETIWIIIAILSFAFIIAFPNNFAPYILAIAFIIISTNILVKKFASKYFSVNIQHEVWGLQKYGWYTRSHFKKPIPAGLIFPFFLTIFSIGIIKPLTFLQFKSKPSKTRVLKKRGNHRYSEVNESDLAFISAWGLWALILLAILGSILKQPELTKYSIYFGIWNLLPISNLDGAKLFFGSLFNWILLAITYIIALVIILI